MTQNIMSSLLLTCPGVTGLMNLMQVRAHHVSGPLSRRRRIYRLRLPQFRVRSCMKKLKLNLDDLKVESFATTPSHLGEPGTVFGQSAAITCQGHQTCNGGGCTDIGTTCAPTCNGMGDGCSDTGTDMSACGGCNWTNSCPGHTCNCGLTYNCNTGHVTDCPGQTDCPPYTEDYTCSPSCTDAGCTYCDNVC